ncbi:outer membrane protein assembly factor BamD [Dissulfurispira thermophila]|uniref:Outer membrane protein assembly factor BamD n=1 Tax=Dissulfurispira thermophila TaxID=2715679 RepID=A0A7G1GZ65_9BACT|nr:outer membrane protein assembly factor BamD [Dissulfurispira thermophila]BCB95362.1 outer membrane protein assembly factor BamD [Dissulfurispira thermophila]
MEKRRMAHSFLLLALCSLLFILASCSGSKGVKKEEGFDPEKYLSRAEILINDKEYEEARKLLLEVKNREMAKKYAPQAQLKIAESYIKDGDIDIGIEEYRKFIELYPDNQYASYAQYQIGMAYFSQIESPDRGSGAAQNALREFIRLKELYPRNPYKEVLELRIEKCRNVIADGEFMVGEFYYKKESYNAAINRLEGLLKQFPDYKRGDEALILLARAYKAANINDKAQETFNKLIEKYPSSRFASEAKKELEKFKGK